VLGILCLISFVSSIREKGIVRSRLQETFHIFLGLFIIVRIVWEGLKGWDGHKEGTVYTFVLNRLGFNLYFTAFTLVLFYWAETYHKNYVSSTQFLPRVFWVFIVSNVGLYAFITLVTVLYLVEQTGEEGDIFYDGSEFAEIGVSFIVSIAFLTYGIRLYLKKGKAAEFEEGHQRINDIIKILVGTLIISACFLVRVFAFLYRPIYQAKMPDEVFQIFGYYIPELIPSLVQFYMIRARKFKEMHESKFVEELYQQEEELYNDEHEMHKNVVNADAYFSNGKRGSSEETLLLEK